MKIGRNYVKKNFQKGQLVRLYLYCYYADEDRKKVSEYYEICTIDSPQTSGLIIKYGGRSQFRDYARIGKLEKIEDDEAMLLKLEGVI